MPRARWRRARIVLPVVRDLGDGVAELFSAYVEAKQRQDVLDYDDLLLYWAHMMTETPSRPMLPSHSIMSWWTNIRTPIGFKPHPFGTQPNGKGLTVVGEMRNPSIRFVRRPCATFSISPVISVRAPKCYARA